jgi:hypothetical protein
MEGPPAGASVWLVAFLLAVVAESSVCRIGFCTVETSRTITVNNPAVLMGQSQLAKSQKKKPYRSSCTTGAEGGASLRA